jgi:chromosome segregation ATPase
MSSLDDNVLRGQKADLEASIQTSEQEWTRFQTMLTSRGISEQEKIGYNERCDHLHEKLKRLRETKTQIERAISSNEEYRKNLAALQQQNIQACKAHEENVRALQSYHDSFRAKREYDKNRKRPF